MTCLVIDASVLVNFLRLDRIDLLTQCAERLVVTEHVVREISCDYPQQSELFHRSRKEGILQVCRIEDSVSLTLFGQLASVLGKGESETIAYAITQGHSVATDDKKAMRKGAQLAPDLTILRTVDLLLLLIRRELLSLPQAEQIREELAAKHRFKTPASFAQLLESAHPASLKS